ncbi:MAG: glycosyltransferase family 4 protein [Alphaproteobacteria bacterium]|nr:glycosyltransferase family 4 protein [Alphaproteobacteria bacterium]
MSPGPRSPRLLFVVNEAHFFASHRLAVAQAALDLGWEVHLAAPIDHVWAPRAFDIAAITRLGIIPHPLPLRRRGINPIEEARTLLALFALFRRLCPDLVHLITIKPVLYGGLAARAAGVPSMVAAVSGLGQVFTADGWHWAALSWLVCRLYALATAHGNGRVIVQNAGDRDVLIQRGAVARHRLEVIRGAGVSLEEFPVAPEPPGPPLIILAGRLLWEKGVGDFVAAARLLRARGVAARCVLVGDTHAAIASAVPRAQIERWASEGIIEWWGRREDMPAVLASCHVVCLPSRYGEGVPKILIEAAAVGRSIVASDTPGCREIVRHGETGLLTPPGDIAALAAALERLLGDAALRSAMGRRGHALVAAGFTTEAVVAQTMAIYERLLGHADRAAVPR